MNQDDVQKVLEEFERERPNMSRVYIEEQLKPELEKLEKECRDLPQAHLEEKMLTFLADSPQRRLLKRFLDRQRELAEKAEKESFEKTYEQAERHHRAIIRSAWIAAAIAAAGALAAWASVWFQSVQTRTALDEFRRNWAIPSVAPTATASPSPLERQL